jgi:hypothetical protein
MGWETRRNSRYFYRKKRCGRRVISIYYGAGEMAEKVSHQVAQDREIEQQQREADRKLMAQMQAEDAAYEAISEDLDVLAKGTLLAAGYHQHRGEWRKKRHARD